MAAKVAILGRSLPSYKRSRVATCLARIKKHNFGAACLKLQHAIAGKLKLRSCIRALRDERVDGLPSTLLLLRLLLVRCWSWPKEHRLHDLAFAFTAQQRRSVVPVAVEVEVELEVVFAVEVVRRLVRLWRRERVGPKVACNNRRAAARCSAVVVVLARSSIRSSAV